MSRPRPLRYADSRPMHGAAPVVPTIVAHRGLHTAFPENSIEAIRAAGAQGIEWVEIDVQSSRDGVPVVIHDDTLDRTTNTQGRVDARRADELRHVRLLNGTGERPTESFLPLLRTGRGDCWFRAIQVGLLVEVKPRDDERLVRAVAGVLGDHPFPVVLQSFDRSNLAHAARWAPHLPRVLLVDTAAALRAAVSEESIGLNVDHRLATSELVRRLHDEGRAIGAWTVNRREDVLRVIDMAVDVMITDEPVLVARLLREHLGRRA